MKKLLYVLSASAVMMWGCENSKESVVEQQQQPSATAPAASAVEASQKQPVAEAAPKATETRFSKFNFEKEQHDFGNIKQGDVVKHVFTFTNEGEAPLVISDIRTTCGCTTPEYTKEPVAPGQTGQIEVQFNSRGKAGVQKKAITIQANVEGGSKIIYITCKVNVEKEVAGPFKQEAS